MSSFSPPSTTSSGAMSRTILTIAEVLRFAPSASRYVERRHWWPTLRAAVLDAAAGRAARRRRQRSAQRRPGAGVGWTLLPLRLQLLRRQPVRQRTGVHLRAGSRGACGARERVGYARNLKSIEAFVVRRPREGGAGLLPAAADSRRAVRAESLGLRAHGGRHRREGRRDRDRHPVGGGRIRSASFSTQATTCAGRRCSPAAVESRRACWRR